MESFKEKMLRYSFIIIAISLVTTGFYLQKNSSQNKLETTAIVIHESSQIKDKPLVAILSYEHKKYVLKLFQVDRMDSNKFQLISRTNIKEAPKELRNDKETNGLWLRNNKKWIYYNGQLEKETRDENYRMDKANNRFIWKKDNDLITLTSLVNENNYTFSINERDKVDFIAPLAKDDSLWLIIINKEVKVLLL